MPKLQPHPLKHRELLKRLRDFGVTEVMVRGKGSERMFVLKSGLSSNYKGPQIPIKFHGDSTEHSVRVIDSILRRFNIAAGEFWK